MQAINPAADPPANRRDRLAAVVRHAGGELVTVDDAATALGLNHVAAAKQLARWNGQGWLRRLRHGLYAPVPPAAAAGDQVLEDPWTLVPALFAPAYIGGLTAAHHWGLTEQLFRAVFVYSARVSRRLELTIQDIPFVVRHVSSDRLAFGTRALWRGRTKLSVSDVHRTVIDMLDAPAAGGGIRHVSDCLSSYLADDDVDCSRLVAYAERLGNGAVFKRLGFLVERLGGPPRLTAACAARLTWGNAKLDPALPCPRLVKRWRLWVPENWKALADTAAVALD